MSPRGRQRSSFAVWWGGWGAISIAAAMVSCRRPIVQLTPLPSGAQAVSLLGDTLWNVPLPPGEGPHLVQQLRAAQRQLTARPSDPAAKLLVARRTAALGRLRDAVLLYNEVIEAEAGSVRLFRRRGELLFQLREFEAAARDLKRAARDPGGAFVKEFVEDSAAGLVGSLVRYQATLGLGILEYARGDYPRAARTLVSALDASDGADELVESALWLGFALRRAGRTQDAAQVFRGIPANVAAKSRSAELLLLQLFRGEVGLDSVRSHLQGGAAADEALVLYGLGFVQLVRADTTGALDAFEQVLLLGQWAVRPSIVAEAEVARLRSRGRGDVRRPP
ncbi:MAG: tetratricopeptide repeat protein [Gemmatimonadales bacterium]